ncbi:very long chain fatty acid elongase 7-like isoform X1 [Musca autumnalis]|uniref:very long chain fatty acid elongase 7-like isoform X1 n=2 Tax=Musca autumnalis TaxID=221902 RepID=UPI003CF7954B
MKFLRLVKENTIDGVLEGLRIDKRVTTHPIFSGPFFMIFTVSLYLYIVRKWGPKFMKGRNPYNVDAIMKLYNVMQIVLNAFIFYESLRYSYWRSDFSFTCRGFDPNDMNPLTLKGARPALLYYVAKYLDLFDTIFFLLRKKFNQISFLHVYHHAFMIFGTHWGLSVTFASHLSLIVVLNSLVHVVMYTYYLLAAMKLNIDLTPWKKRMTIMQLLQFVTLLVHQILPFIHNPCNMHYLPLIFGLSQSVMMLVLFSNFYYKSYICTDKKRKRT